MLAYLHVPSAVHEAFAVVGIPTHHLFLITKEIRYVDISNFTDICRSMYKPFKELMHLRIVLYQEIPSSVLSLLNEHFAIKHFLIQANSSLTILSVLIGTPEKL